MNAGAAHAHESTFGPASEPIDINSFALTESGGLRSDSTTQIPPGIAEECSVADIRKEVQDTWDNVKLSGYLLRDHELVVNNVHITAESKKKRKRIINYEALKIPHAAVQDLQESLKCISKNLQCWPYSAEAALFMRAPKNTDFNVLDSVKRSTSNFDDPNATEAILTITVHNTLSWGHNYLSRASTHLIRSSQTLQDLYDCLICESSEIPEEIIEDGEVFGYSQVNNADNKPCVMCIEGLAYGDGHSNPDYADKLIEQIGLMPEEKRPKITKANSTLATTRLDSLLLRINEPYYMLHHGNCEHFIVVDQIRPVTSTPSQGAEILTSLHRLQRPSDSLSEFPITTHITPVLLDLCRGCCKVPAVYAIVGDVRLPESPCVMCEPCWTNMGPSDDSEVSVVPLPRRIQGWER
ncbi:hypothetical protein PC9H_007466 [Pleurotus ostreatus]|uniref:snRNA-activating protein complex subunit 3 n=1 Tax=Pleurotus ostreatus TaxID=5322 RepID=A0A8H6ZR57_PLEOS|nr:uncharacterized protein PC9H_007466 [Pleurotus ostreatus]KAF7428245.1 hypothetical protein PC9H_007466 [Pleurotus ostreatus]